MHFLNCPIGRGVRAFERTWIFAKTLRARFFIACVTRFFHATPTFRVAVYAEIRCCEYCQKQMTTTEHGTPLRFPRRSNPVSCELKPFPFIFLKKYKLSPIPLYFLKECQGFCSFPCIYLGNCKSFAIPFYFLIQDTIVRFFTATWVTHFYSFFRCGQLFLALKKTSPPYTF